MIRNKTLASIFTLFLLLPIAFLGCSGGSSDTTVLDTSPVKISQAIEVLPSDYDFGSVTPSNLPAPLEVTILNNGSGVLSVSDITLSDTNNFALDLTGGSNPCNTASSTVPAGDSCTLEVAFRPQSANSFSTTLNISSNDPNTPTVNVPISGSQEEVFELDVTINQVETDGGCPATITAYVSVSDQGGYPVSGLTKDNFSIAEDDTSIANGDFTVSFLDVVTAPISVTLVMDNSGSMRDAGAISPMTEASVEFANQLDEDDEAEIIKFATVIDVVQPFTFNKVDLINAIEAEWEGTGTALYDAVDLAVAHTAVRASDRKAVIVITDGLEYGTSNLLINELIDNAKSLGVPVFVVGLGDNIDVDSLQQIADETGGKFYEADTAQNLKTIYQQLADILFDDQYILTYISGLGAGDTANLTIQAISGTIEGEDTKEITPCP